jgi:hypothetical protein
LSLVTLEGTVLEAFDPRRLALPKGHVAEHETLRKHRSRDVTPPQSHASEQLARILEYVRLLEAKEGLEQIPLLSLR